MWGREGDPYPTHTHELHIVLNFVLLMHITCTCKFVQYLFTLFDTHAHKTNNTTVPVTWCTKMQNKHELLTMVHSVLY